MRRCEAGHIVQVETDNHYTQDAKSGMPTYLRNNGKGCVVDMWVPMTEDATTPSFSGQGEPYNQT